jgi:predicted NUDIX family phosphoesterase
MDIPSHLLHIDSLGVSATIARSFFQLERSGEGQVPTPQTEALAMEFVYVVPREKLFPDCYPQGLALFQDPQERRDLEERIREHGFFVERAYAEKTPLLKQVIPYTIVQVGERVLVLRRLDRGGERRLHGKLSIGVGGHINPQDHAEGESPIERGARRELAEELDISGTYDLRIAGLLNDDSNPVGAVHVGLVQVADVHGKVTLREHDVLEGRLVSREELLELSSRAPNFETWSSILLERLDDLVSLPQPAPH